MKPNYRRQGTATRLAALLLLSAASFARAQSTVGTSAASIQTGGRPAREEFELLGFGSACSAAFRYYRYPATGEGLEDNPSWGRIGIVTLAPDSTRETVQWVFEQAGGLNFDKDLAAVASENLVRSGWSRKAYRETVRPDPTADRPGLDEMIRSTTSFELGYAVPDWPSRPMRLSQVHYSPLSTCALAVFELDGAATEAFRWKLVRLPADARRARAQAHVVNAQLLYSDYGDIYGALEETATAAAMDPRFAEGRYKHAILLGAHGRFEDALKELEAALALDRRYARMAKEAIEFQDVRKQSRFKDLVR